MMKFRIKSYDPLNLSYPIPLATFSHPELKTNSFYLKLVNSTRGDYLGCGGSDGGIYVWDSNGNGKDGIRLKGHEKEVGGLAWGYDTVSFLLSLSTVFIANEEFVIDCELFR